MKKLVIIIPGSKTKSLPLIQPLLNQFYTFFGVETGNDNWPIKIQNTINNKIDTLIFNWAGGISEKFSIKPAAKKLHKILNEQYDDYDHIVLFGKSLGGIVAEKAINENNKIKKLIYVATPHKTSNKHMQNNIKIINVYSDNDTYQKLANKILYFGLGKQKLSNANNICINDITHSEFNHNKQVKINDKKTNLFDFYKKLILE